MNLAILCAEIMFFVLAIYIIYRFVGRKGYKDLVLFFGLTAYGIFLEWITIYLTGGYHYAGYLLMIGTVPYAIGFMWAILIYTAMRTTDLMGLPEHIKPVADATLVAAVDLAMDPVAVSLGLWHWGIPGHWFGIPLANYFGWYNAVFIFSIIWRGSDYYIKKWEGIIPKEKLVGIRAVTVVILATIVLGISLLVYYLNLSVSLQVMLLVGMFLGGAVLIAIYLPKLRTDHAPLPYLLLPIFAIFMFFFLAMLYLGGFSIIFIVIYLIIFAISIMVRMIPFWDRTFGN
jgi:uncharacterized membrane protein